MEQTVAVGTDAEAVVFLLAVLVVLVRVIGRHHIDALLGEQRVRAQRGQPAVDVMGVGDHVAQSHRDADIDRLRCDGRRREMRLMEQIHVVDERGVVHAERLKDALAQKVVVALSRDDFHDTRQQEVVGVGVLERRIRLKLQRLTQQPVLEQTAVLLGCVVVGDHAAQLAGGKLREGVVDIFHIIEFPDTRTHVKKMTDGQVFCVAVVREESRQVFIHIELAVLLEQQNRRSGKLLGHRADAELRIRRNRLIRHIVFDALCRFADRLSVLRHQHNAAEAGAFQQRVQIRLLFVCPA